MWYERHLMHLRDVTRGEATISPEVLKLALDAADQKRRQYGLETLIAADKFECGMLNGKLSALHWVIGDEWDWLDTWFPDATQLLLNCVLNPHLACCGCVELRR